MTNLYLFKYYASRLYLIGRGSVDSAEYEPCINYLEQICTEIEGFAPSFCKSPCKDIAGYVIPFDVANPILDTLELLEYDLRNGSDGYPLVRHYE